MLKKLLLTGAAGGVGRAIRPLLGEIAESVVLSDIGEITDLAPTETFIRCNLADKAASTACSKVASMASFISAAFPSRSPSI